MMDYQKIIEELKERINYLNKKAIAENLIKKWITRSTK